MFISLAEAGEYINNCPVPDNLKIIAPDGNVVPPKLALLSGVWEGNWASSAILIVEQIKEKEAVVVLAWAAVTARTQAGTSYAPGFVRLKCPIEQGEDGNYRIWIYYGGKPTIGENHGMVWATVKGATAGKCQD